MAAALTEEVAGREAVRLPGKTNFSEVLLARESWRTNLRAPSICWRSASVEGHGQSQQATARRNDES